MWRSPLPKGILGDPHMIASSVLVVHQRLEPSSLPWIWICPCSLLVGRLFFVSKMIFFCKNSRPSPRDCWEIIWWILKTYSLYERRCIDTHHILTSPLQWGHTQIDTRLEEHMSRTCLEPQAIAWVTSYVSPLHLIEGTGMYTIYYSTTVDCVT